MEKRSNIYCEFSDQLLNLLFAIETSEIGSVEIWRNRCSLLRLVGWFYLELQL